MVLSLLMPADFPVGRYRMVVAVAPEGSKRGERLDADKDMVVLFNPWCEGRKHILLYIVHVPQFTCLIVRVWMEVLSFTCSKIIPCDMLARISHPPSIPPSTNSSRSHSPSLFLHLRPHYCFHLCTDDAVFLPNEADREEYIMNESGIIWAGAHNDMFTWPWNFAQVSSMCGVTHQ